VREALKLLQVAQDKGSVGHVHGVLKSTSNAKLMVFQCRISAKASGSSSKKWWLTTPEVLETASDTVEVQKTLKIVWKGAGTVGDSSHAGGPSGGASHGCGSLQNGRKR